MRPRDRRARARRAPARVRIRRRNPWVFLRLRLLGWNVRFTRWPPQATDARSVEWDRAGGGKRSVYGRSTRRSQRGTAPARRPRGRVSATLVTRLGTLIDPLSRPGVVLRCAPRVAAAGVADFPGGLRLDKAASGRIPVLPDLHNCGRSCGNEDGWCGPVTADELWDQGAARPADTSSPRDLDRLVPRRVPPISTTARRSRGRGRVLVLARPELVAADRIRSSYRGMLDDAIRDRTGGDRHVELARRDHIARGRHRHPPRRRRPSRSRRPSAIGAGDRTVAGRPRRDRRPRRRHLGLGHAEPALHLRPVRHRRVQPLRARRRAVGRREPGAGPTTRCSSTGRRGWARPTCCTRSATTSRTVFRNKRVRYVSTESFMNEFVDAIRDRRPCRRSSAATATSTCC